MARLGHPVFDAIADALAPVPSTSILDLGCGKGPAIHTLLAREPSLLVTGLDVDPRSIEALAAESLPCVVAAVADLNDTLPYPDGSFDGAISHNVLECLDDAVALLDDTARVLKPGGRAVWSHVDFDGIVIAGADRDLTRAVLHAYADHPPRFMPTADGQIGRGISGLVNQSRLDLVDVAVHHTTSHTLTGDALARIEEITEAVQAEAAGLTRADVTTWARQLVDADRDGRFLFSEPCFIVTSTSA